MRNPRKKVWFCGVFVKVNLVEEEEEPEEEKEEDSDEDFQTQSKVKEIKDIKYKLYVTNHKINFELVPRPIIKT